MIAQLKRGIKRLAVRALARIAQYNPADQAAIEQLFGTGAEPEINETTALNLSGVWAGVRTISETLGALPLPPYKRLAKGKEKLVSDPRYRMAVDEPNPEMSAPVFYETLAAHCLTHGNAYAEIERAGGGMPLHLWPLDPAATFKERHPDTGAIRYRVDAPDGRPYYLNDDSVIHVPGLGYDGLTGYNVIAFARQSLTLAAAAERYGVKHFTSGQMPAGTLETEDDLDDDAVARLRESWEKQYGGLSRSHRVAILQQGLKFNKISLTAEEAQFLQTRQFQIAEIARWFRLPPHKIGDLSRATFNNIEQSNIDFVTDSILPMANKFAREFTRKLAMPSERGTVFFEHLFTSLLRGDTSARYAAYKTGREGGWLSVNDIREMENMNPIDGGDEYITPMNMRPSNEPNPQKEQVKE